MRLQHNSPFGRHYLHLFRNILRHRELSGRIQGYAIYLGFLARTCTRVARIVRHTRSKRCWNADPRDRHDRCRSVVLFESSETSKVLSLAIQTLLECEEQRCRIALTQRGDYEHVRGALLLYIVYIVRFYCSLQYLRAGCSYSTTRDGEWSDASLLRSASISQCKEIVRWARLIWACVILSNYPSLLPRSAIPGSP